MVERSTLSSRQAFCDRGLLGFAPEKSRQIHAGSCCFYFCGSVRLRSANLFPPLSLSQGFSYLTIPGVSPRQVPGIRRFPVWVNACDCNFVWQKESTCFLADAAESLLWVRQAKDFFPCATLNSKVSGTFQNRRQPDHEVTRFSFESDSKDLTRCSSPKSFSFRVRFRLVASELPRQHGLRIDP